ncbi:MAG: response regulator, partial [Nitriliruptorales bacterium]|nr:response regulator [Nitriliruptorales bacterium]
HETRVLVIDDEPADCRYAELIIGNVDPEVEVYTATNGSRGLLLCGRLSPAVVLLDVRMPGINGIDVARSLRRVEGLENIDLYFLTGADTTDVEDVAAEVGAAAVLRKPLSRDDVRRFLDRAGHPALTAD